MGISLMQARKMWAKDDDQIRTNVRVVMAGAGMTQTEFCKVLGMSKPTFRSRLKSPGTFTQGEMRIIDYYAEKHGITLKKVC